MSQQGDPLEENTARLIRAAYRLSTRPTAQMSKEMLRSLSDHARARSATPAFPDIAIVILGGLLAALPVWLAVQAFLSNTSLVADPSLLATALWLVLNLGVVPVASILIVIRRRYGRQTG
jgi:hypothetical protein